MDLPLGLVRAIESGNCVLFLGAGIGHYLRDADGNNAPGAEDLARGLADRFKIEIEEGEKPQLAQIAQLVELRRGRAELIAYLEKRLTGLEPDEHLRWLLSLTWRAIFTTNYDGGIERCYELNPSPTQRPVVIATNSETTTWDPRFEVPIFHLHGSLFSAAAKEAILVTERDYAVFRERRAMLFQQFGLQFATTPILYVGYSHDDANWRMVTAEVEAEFAPQRPPPSFRVAPKTPSIDREILASQGLETLDGGLEDLEAAVVTTLGALRVEPHQLKAIEAGIPQDLRDSFAAAPAAVARLLNSWDYVNQADFDEAPNSRPFFRGDRPNWAVVGKGINFQRDLEEPLVERLMDFATDPNPRTVVEIILGPAGYGMTTLLMAVAAWFVRSRTGTAIFLKPGMPLLPGDVEFAATNLAKPLILVVDNAADYADEVATSVQLLRGLDVPAFVLLGERLNEWRQRRPAIRPAEYALDPLSDGEIDRLLACLEQSGELGRLADVGYELRFSAVKVRNQQELLVTMREVTEGRAFDAIIEDEYRSIDNDAARDLYAVVAAFSRARALARDALCADVLKVNLAELYTTLAPALEGIVTFDVYDQARALSAARTRHHVIADIVWSRCLDRLTREELLLDALGALNLTFGVDVKAFEAFTRDDNFIDSLGTLEAKTRFFENACRKDPLNAYVRQHYARMLRRERRYELALSQIDIAIEMKPNTRVLLHTRGVILRDLAIDADNVEVGRRRLAQSEAAFASALNLNARDEYTYASLAELYLDWARKAPTAEESIEYVTKAEDTIYRGLQVVRQRDGLYIVSSHIENFLGDTPGRVAALRKALTESPQSAVARYLLGTVLRKQGHPDEASQILYEGLTLNPEDPRLATAYALARHAEGRPYSECIGALNLARNQGLQDPLFIAVYGGMLAMDGQLSPAKDVWKRSAEQTFTIQEKSRVGFEPQQEERSLQLDGSVVKVGPGYAFVRVPSMPDFFCSSTKYSGVPLREGDAVKFRPGFTARGPVVMDLTVEPGGASLTPCSSPQADGAGEG